MECIGVGNTDTGKPKVAETIIRALHLLLSSRVPHMVLFLTIFIFAVPNNQIGDLEVSLSVETNFSLDFPQNF